jgi:thiol-disulfide isomerase/thioredoxin
MISRKLTGVLALSIALTIVNIGTLLAETSEKPIVVKVHADWCGSCTRLKPTWERIEERLGDQARLVVFDVTSKESLQEAKVKADQLGILEVFKEYKSRTGTIAVLDGETHRVVQVFKGEQDFTKYEKAVAQASH